VGDECACDTTQTCVGGTVFDGGQCSATNCDISGGTTTCSGTDFTTTATAPPSLTGQFTCNDGGRCNCVGFSGSGGITCTSTVGNLQCVDLNRGSQTPGTGDGAFTVANCPQFDTTAGTCADPHIHSPFGATFDFKGKPRGDYTLFSTSNFVLNMHMADYGPDVHYISEAALVFRNVSISFDVLYHAEHYIEQLNKILAPVGASASAKTKFSTVLNLCPGERVVVTQMVTLTLPHYYYLDLQVSAPGCSAYYGGVLGQTYHCKYASRDEKFEWDPNAEESFRVSSLMSIGGAFVAHQKCDSKGVELLSSVSGGLMGKTDAKR